MLPSSNIAAVSTFAKVDSCEVYSSFLWTDHTSSFVQAARPVVMKRPTFTWIFETDDAIPLWTWIGYPKVSLHQLLLQGDACPLDHLNIQPQPLLLVDHLGHILLFGVSVCRVGHKVEDKKYFY